MKPPPKFKRSGEHEIRTRNPLRGTSFPMKPLTIRLLSWLTHHFAGRNMIVQLSKTNNAVCTAIHDPDKQKSNRREPKVCPANRRTSSLYNDDTGRRQLVHRHQPAPINRDLFLGLRLFSRLLFCFRWLGFLAGFGFLLSKRLGPIVLIPFWRSTS